MRVDCLRMYAALLIRPLQWFVWLMKKLVINSEATLPFVWFQLNFFLFM
jgi:hypothetical protein